MTTGTERRRFERKRVYFAGEILARAASNGVARECAIRSISPAGACIDAPVSAPATFDLRVVRDGSIRRATTVWVSDNRRGVMFADDEAATAKAKGASIAELRRSVRMVEAK
jgi:hypothetical protein